MVQSRRLGRVHRQTDMEFPMGEKYIFPEEKYHTTTAEFSIIIKQLFTGAAFIIMKLVSGKTMRMVFQEANTILY